MFIASTKVMPIRGYCWCGERLEEQKGKLVCPKRRWWNYWKHKRSHKGWLPMRKGPLLYRL